MQAAIAAATNPHRLLHIRPELREVTREAVGLELELREQPAGGSYGADGQRRIFLWRKWPAAQGSRSAARRAQRTAFKQHAWPVGWRYWRRVRAGEEDGGTERATPSSFAITVTSRRAPPSPPFIFRSHVLTETDDAPLSARCRHEHKPDKHTRPERPVERVLQYTISERDPQAARASYALTNGYTAALTRPSASSKCRPSCRRPFCPCRTASPRRSCWGPPTATSRRTTPSRRRAPGRRSCSTPR